MEKIEKYFLWILILLPATIVFKNVFDLNNPLVWGDAPYFYPENLNELFNLPFAWEIRNSNFGSPQLLTLWLHIPTFLMGLLYKFTGLSNEILIRIIFYLPFMLASFSGVYLLLSKFRFGDLAKILGILFFTLNTYSILLFDGGQIGVLLSYGLFPLAVFAYINLLEKKSLRTFLVGLICHTFIFNIDLRIALLLVLFELIWWAVLIKEKDIKQISVIISLYILTFGLSAYWITPFLFALQNNSPEASINTGENFITLSNSFYLFQPHFPNNDFGNLNKTPIYFIFMPFILFLGLLQKNRQTIIISSLFLIFVFLSKGSSPPLGEVYNFLVNKVPLGGAFRDSSKFYIPAILLGSILIAGSVDLIKAKLKSSQKIWLTLTYLFLLITIFPSLIGNMSGVLGIPPDKTEYNLARQLIKEGGEFRSLWFKEKPSMGFADWSHPPVSANSLFKERPFSSMIDGDYDLFGFLHNKNISKWYELLGINYIFYPPYEREKSLTQQERADKKLFEIFISKIPQIEKVNSPISFPVYKTKNPSRKFLAQEKVILFVGGDEIYERLFDIKNFKLEKTAVIPLENCDFNPDIIFNLEKESYGLLAGEDRSDFLMSFFCDYLISPGNSQTREWAINNSSQYLNWKAQLLERGVKNYDYDFKQGLSYSSARDEKLHFEFNTAPSQNYYLAIRYLTASDSSGIKVDPENTKSILKSKNPNKLEWKILGPIMINSKKFSVILTNLGGLSVVNTLALIPEQVFDKQNNQIKEKLKDITVLDPNNDPQLEDFLKTSYLETDFKQINPTDYKFSLPNGANWLIFSERFDPNWLLINGVDAAVKPLPAYSMLNGYYVGNLQPKSGKLIYQPQENVNIGVLISLVIFLLVCFALILHIIIKGRTYENIKEYFWNTKN